MAKKEKEVQYHANILVIASLYLPLPGATTLEEAVAKAKEFKHDDLITAGPAVEDIFDSTVKVDGINGDGKVSL